MNQHKQSSDLNLGRGWLNRAAEMLDSCEDHRSDAEFATAAAAIGNGFVALAQAQMSAPVSLRLMSEMPPALISAVERAGRAAAEARPHDDEDGDREARFDAAALDVVARLSEPHDDEPVNLCETDADMAARFAGQIGELTSRIEDALTWIDEPDDATPEIQLAKIRAALTGQARRG